MRLIRSADTRWVRWLFAAGLALVVHAGSTHELRAQSRQIVYVVPVNGIIDMGLAPFIQRILNQAADDRAAAVILDINTFGGRVDAAVIIRDALLSSNVLTVAFVNRRAISAGALISLAAQRIAISDGGTIGAATPVQIGQTGSAPSPVDEKTVSYVRKEFRSTAESRNRPLLIAEAMVDADVEIPGLVEKGKLLTLSTDEALKHGVADFRAATLDAVLAELALTGAEVRRPTPNWGEHLLRLITHPVVASLLLSIAMLGILIELRTPGFGVAGALGVASLALVLGGHWIVELVGWEELILIGLGMVFLALEIFVIPGFGVAGAAGIASLLAGVTLGLVGHGPSVQAVLGVAGRVAFSMLAALAASILLWRYLPQTSVGRRLMLETELTAGGGYSSAPDRDARLLGSQGRATSTLRPAGIAEFDGERVDVVSEGEMIEAGAPIVVSRIDGNRIVVRRHRSPEEGMQS